MKQIKISVIMLVIFTAVTGGIYPLLITGIGQVFFSEKINGSLIERNGSIIGSELIGQKFERPGFFHGRPSAVQYDAAGSGGSNLGPANKNFAEIVKNRFLQIKKDYMLSDITAIPSDFLFSSGSGLDPHISIETAMLQADKIAAARKIDKSIIIEIINKNCENRFYFPDDSYVNVLKLNLALIDNGDVK